MHCYTVPYASLPVYRNNNEIGSDQPPLARDNIEVCICT